MNKIIARVVPGPAWYFFFFFFFSFFCVSFLFVVSQKKAFFFLSQFIATNRLPLFTFFQSLSEWRLFFLASCDSFYYIYFFYPNYDIYHHQPPSPNTNHQTPPHHCSFFLFTFIYYPPTYTLLVKFLTFKIYMYIYIIQVPDAFFMLHTYNSFSFRSSKKMTFWKKNSFIFLRSCYCWSAKRWLARAESDLFWRGRIINPSRPFFSII